MPSPTPGAATKISSMRFVRIATLEQIVRTWMPPLWRRMMLFSIVPIFGPTGPTQLIPTPPPSMIWTRRIAAVRVSVIRMPSPEWS